MTIEQTVRLSLGITAPFNLGAAAAFAWPSTWLGSLLGLPVDVHPFYAYFSGAMVGLFGLAYLWMAFSATLSRPLLCVGASGKSLAVLIAWGLYLSNDLSGLTALIISGDIAFAGLWFYFLATNTSSMETT